MNPQPTNKLMKKTLLLAATLMVALPGATQADPPVGPGQPPIRQIFPGPQAVPLVAPAHTKLAQQLAQVEKQIADLQNFLARANLTEAAAKQYDAKLKDLRAQRDKLRAKCSEATCSKLWASSITTR